MLHAAGSARLLRGFFALQFLPFLNGYVEDSFALSASTAWFAMLMEVDFSLQLVEFRVRHFAALRFCTMFRKASAIAPFSQPFQI